MQWWNKRCWSRWRNAVVALDTIVNNFLRSIFFTMLRFTTTITNITSPMDFIRRSRFFCDMFKEGTSECKWVLHCGWYACEYWPDANTTSQSLRDNPNVSLGGVLHFSLYTSRAALKYYYHTKRTYMLAYTPVKFIYSETLATNFTIIDRQNQIVDKKKYFMTTPFPRIAIAMNMNSVFIETYTEKWFWFQQCDLRQIRILRRNQAVEEIDCAGCFWLYVTTMKAINFQDDIPSILIHSFSDHYLLVFDLTSTQDATESFTYAELVEEPVRLELNFTFPVERIKKLILLGEGMFSVGIDKFGGVGKNT